MVSFETMLFNTNEALHHMCILGADKYITASTLAFSIITTFLLAPMMGRVLSYLFENETFNKYIAEINLVAIFGILFFMKAYGAIVFCVMIFIFLKIIYSHSKYKYIQDYIERIL